MVPRIERRRILRESRDELERAMGAGLTYYGSYTAVISGNWDFINCKKSIYEHIRKAKAP